MKPGQGKNKGSFFERDVCSKLSLWVTDGKSDDCFWRSSMSGGRATSAFKKRGQILRATGDIAAIAPEGHLLTDNWFIECKHYKNLEITRFLLHNAGTLAIFWAKAKEEAVNSKKAPVLIAKQNRIDTLLITDSKSCPLDHMDPACSTIHGAHVFLFEKVLSTKFAGLQLLYEIARD